MTLENKYNTLTATIKGRLEGLENFNKIWNDEEAQTVKNGKIQIKELKSLLELIESFEKV